MSQKKELGEAFVTTALFDDQYELLHDHIGIKDVKLITNKEYYARGCTALLDAIGKTINSVGARLNETEEDGRPDKVVFVIITDGFENFSREFTKKQVKDMIEHQQKKYAWTFMFLGANMDAVEVASSLGVNPDFARTYTATNVGTQSVYNSMTKAMSCIRGSDADLTSVNSTSYKAVMDALDETE